MKNLLLIILALFAIGCKKIGIEFNIKNNSLKTCKNIIISNGFTSIYIDSIKSKDSSKIFLNFNGDIPKTDGNFEIKYNFKNKIYEKKFGYFSNGIPLQEKIGIEILQDTIYIK